MKTITKLLLTAAFLVLGIGGAKAAKKTIYTMDYSNEQSFNFWKGNVGTISVENGLLVIKNTEAQANVFDLQLFIGNGITTTAGLDYKVKIEYKATFDDVEGNSKSVWVGLGGWSNRPTNYGVTITEANDFQTLTLDFANFYQTASDNFVMWQSGKTVGTIYIKKVEVIEITPTIVEFDEEGKAYFDLTDITVSGETLSYDDQTGTVTSSGTSGTININFDKAYDLSALTHWTAAMTGDDIVQHWKLVGAKNNGSELDMWSGEYDRAFPGNLTNPDFSAITGIIMYVNATGTLKFTKGSIYLTSDVITSTPGNEVAISTLERKYYENGEWKTSTVTTNYGTGISTPLGDGNATQDEYIDLSSYSELRLYISSGEPRLFLVKEANFTPTAEGYILTKEGVKQNGQWNGIQDTDHKLVKNGDYYFITVSDIQAACGGQAKLIGVKAEYGQTVTISNIVVIDPTSTYNYVLSGSGTLTNSAKTALADANATIYNATGITKAVALTTANPNALIVTKDGMVTNAQNVIVDGTCANLVLTDGYPFKAPDDFTATAASYTTTINAAGAGTLCLPFNAAIPQGVKAWTLTYTGGENATATKITGTIPANTPVLLNGSGSATFTGAEATIDADATNESGALTGVFEAGEVPTGSYVLQFDETNTNIGFFKVDSSDPITINPFRAYLTAGANSSRISIVYEDELAGIEGIAEQRTEDVSVYDLQGRRVAQPTKGLYIVGGKKVIK